MYGFNMYGFNRKVSFAKTRFFWVSVTIVHRVVTQKIVVE